MQIVKNEKVELTELQKKIIERMQQTRIKVYPSYEAYLGAEDKRSDNYFPSKSGWMVARIREIDGNDVEFISKAKECPIGEDISEKVTLSVTNKIPGNLLKEILANFNKVNADSGNECAAQIYREKDGDKKYFIYYPEQKVSSAQVTYAHDPKLMELAANYDLIMELHSHDTMGAFWSGTDDNNENTCGFYMVIGRFNSPVVEYKCRVKLDSTYINFECSRIFDFGDESETEVLTRANFIAPTDELDKKITKESLGIYASYKYYGDSYSYTDLWDYTPHYSYDRYTTSDSLSKRELKRKLEKAPDVIPFTDPLYDAVWDHAVFNSKAKRWEFGDYVEDTMSATPGWIREGKNRVTKGEGGETDVGATEYVKRISKGFSKKGFTQQSDKVKELVSGRDSIEYLNGKADEDTAKYGVLPGKIQQYTNFDLNIDFNDSENYASNLNMAVASRVRAQSNIEAVLRDGIEAVREDTDNKFIRNVLNAAFNSNSNPSININVFWELLTPVEKNRLARTFHTTVLDLAARLHSESQDVEAPSDVAEFLYRCTLADPKYVEAKLGLTAVKIVAENPKNAQEFVNAIHNVLTAEKEEDK